MRKAEWHACLFTAQACLPSIKYAFGSKLFFVILWASAFVGWIKNPQTKWGCWRSRERAAIIQHINLKGSQKFKRGPKLSNLLTIWWNHIQALRHKHRWMYFDLDRCINQQSFCYRGCGSYRLTGRWHKRHLKVAVVGLNTSTATLT